MKVYDYKGQRVQVSVSRNIVRATIRIYDADTGDLVKYASEDIQPLIGMPHYVAIEFNPENIYTLKFLMENGIVSEPATTVKLDTGDYSICKLL